MSGSIKIPVTKLSGAMKTTKKIDIAVKPMPVVTKAHAALQKKYDALGGEAALGAIPDGSPTRKIWDFGTQCLVYNAQQDAAFHVMGDIYSKWKALGGDWIPDTDETATPDGMGRYNHFSDSTASIYWTPDTGACAIYGDIRKRWSELGWERGALGYPTSDEGDIDEGGRANSFQHGWIYWWPDIGAIDLGDIVLSYTGFYAYKESDHDQSSGSDEPYCIFTILAPKAKNEPYTLRSKVYGGVDDSSARPDHLELYRGPAYGLIVGVVGMEHDNGDPDKNKELVQGIVKANHEVGKFMLQFIPLVGPIISKIAGPLLDGIMPKIGAAIANLLDLGDDRVGSVSVALPTKKLVTLATRGSVSDLKGIHHKLGSGTMAHGGARYEAFFSVDPA